LKAEGNLSRLIYKRRNGSDWVSEDTNIGLKDINKHISMASINGYPVIVYSVLLDDRSEIRTAGHNGSTFLKEAVGTTDTSNPLIEITEYQTTSAISFTNNPLKVYFSQQDPKTNPSQIYSTFVCDCSSDIFSNNISNISNLSKWKSSAYGHSDTRITESNKNSMHPSIKTRVTDTAVIS